ncbi:polysaccharide biosynthesis/export family protein [Prosthecobacter sp. SYSU 5D2]|uniref:polysaccharide biosynthesis/export family protein n=1 Tax=Prosthecobacter sp. SYSU 5D2 TaxID=3134134 RepID=UPI0031FEE2E1
MMPVHFPIVWKYFSTCALLLLLASCAKTQSDEAFPGPVAVVPPTIGQPVKPNAFRAGDTLELFVKEDSTLNGSYAVREGGYIVIPRAGRITVSGFTREEIEPKLKEFLQKSQLTQASVIVERLPGASSSSGPGSVSGESIVRVPVYITGSVPRSGLHAIPVPPGKIVGVYEALLISGGLGKFATLGKVEIFRFDSSGKRKKAIVDLRPIMKGEADDPPISEGDIINVPEKVFGF